MRLNTLKHWWYNRYFFFMIWSIRHQIDDLQAILDENKAPYDNEDDRELLRDELTELRSTLFKYGYTN
jgi:hypothetical protein